MGSLKENELRFVFCASSLAEKSLNIVTWWVREVGGSWKVGEGTESIGHYWKKISRYGTSLHFVVD